MGNLSFCKLSYRAFKRLNSCESRYFGPLTRPSATLSPGRGFENGL